MKKGIVAALAVAGLVVAGPSALAAVPADPAVAQSGYYEDGFDAGGAAILDHAPDDEDDHDHDGDGKQDHAPEDHDEDDDGKSKDDGE